MNGGAIGSILIGTLDELERRDLKRGLVTLCAAGGMAPAVIVELVLAGRPECWDNQTIVHASYMTAFPMRSALSASIVRCRFICDVCPTRVDGRKRLISA